MQLSLPERCFRRPRIGPALVMELRDTAEEALQLPKGSLQTHSREPHLSHARFAVMKVASDRGRTLATIGRCLGGLHHTSVLHGIRRASQLEKTDAEFADLLWFLREVSQ